MSSSLRYKTTESSRFILTEMYRSTDEEFFTCTIEVPEPRLDDVREGTLQLELKRMHDKSHTYQIANGDRIYRTRARFKGYAEEFDIDVIIRSRQADIVGATISINREAVGIFKEISER